MHSPSDRPRFRQDLVAETIEDGGARFIDVMDPDSGNLFRFYEVEYSLACGMDGERDVAGIVKWAQDELGLSPSQQEVRTVIAALGDLGFIDSRVDGELARGVVADRKTPPPSGIEVELGHAGTNAHPAAPLPKAPDIGLGAPGAASSTLGAKPATPGENIALGAPGRTDVSIDLAEHMPVRPADVKEAVRQSKVMAAVEVPDLDDVTVKAPEPPAKPRALTPVPIKPEPPRTVTPVPAKQPEPAPIPKTPPPTRTPTPVPAAKPPVELPKAPAVERPIERTKPPVEKPTAPSAGVSPVLIAVLVLVALAAGGFLVWKYVLQKDDADQATTTPPVKPPPDHPAAPPPPPPTAKIAMETPAPDDIKATSAGMIETIVAADTQIKAGEVVVKLVGDKPIEAEIAAITRDEKKVQTDIDNANKQKDAAQAAGNKAAETAAQNKIDDAQKTLTAKQAALATKTSELDKFLLHAPADGKVTPVAKLGQKIAADDVVAKLQRNPAPVATFKVTNGKPFAPNSSVEISKGEQKAICTVTDVQAQSVKVSCPSDAPFTDGADVTLRPTGSAEAPSTPPMPSGRSPSAPPAPAPTAPAPTAPPPTPAPGPSPGSAAPPAPAAPGSASPAAAG